MLEEGFVSEDGVKEWRPLHIYTVLGRETDCISANSSHTRTNMFSSSLKSTACRGWGDPRGFPCRIIHSITDSVCK